MTFDPFKRVKWNDGEEITQQDLNDIQDFALSRLFDQVLGANTPFNTGSIGGSLDPDVASSGRPQTQWAYVTNPAQAHLLIGSTGDKIRIAAGTIFQLITINIDGSTPQFIPFYFDGSATYEWQIAPGGGVNPRVDLLQVALSWADDDSQSRNYDSGTPPTLTIVTASLFKKRRVSCTLSVKQGTAAASPRIPDPDVGCVAVGAVCVNSGWPGASVPIAQHFDVGVSNGAFVFDLRMPLGVRAYRTDPALFKLDTAWALAGANRYVTNSNATNSLTAYYNGPPSGRIVGFGFTRRPTTTSITGTFTFIQAQDLTVPSITPLNTWTSRSNALAGVMAEDIQAWSQIENVHAPVSGAIIQQSFNSYYGMPLWGTGLRGFKPRNQIAGANGDGLRQLAMKIDNMNLTANLGYMTWWVAEGL